MPDHKIHNIAAIRVFGLAVFDANEDMFKEIDKYMDQAQSYMQSNHRELFHDMDTVMMIQAERGELGGKAALLHLYLDKVSDTVGQERSVEVLVEMLNKGELVL